MRNAPLGPNPASPPNGWRDEIIYFLLPDRFSDGRERSRTLLYDPTWPDLSPDALAHPPYDDSPYVAWRWDLWAISGRNRFQGGTINGIRSKLPYLAGLGVTALWVGPVWRQRAAGVDQNLAYDGTDDVFLSNADGLAPDAEPLEPAEVVFPSDTYHGYAIQGFDDVDPRFGSVADLTDLVTDAHAHGIRVILDIVINHTGVNFCYDTPIVSRIRPPYQPPSPASPEHRYSFGSWLGVDNKPVSEPYGRDDAVWPESLRHEELYSRQGEGDYGAGVLGVYNAEYQVADWRNRDLAYTGDGRDPALDAMVTIWSGWLERTDCDGFRVDTFKHVPRPTAEAFVRRIRRHAAERLGKHDFLIMAEIGGPEIGAASYLDIDGLRVLELGARRSALRALAGGQTQVDRRFVLQPTVATVLSEGADATIGADTVERVERIGRGEPSAVADRFVTTIDDHDGLGLDRKERITATYGPGSVVPAAALLLYGPGVPCLYYGTEQALRGAVGVPTGLLDRYLNSPDRYLREAMFGPEHPRLAGLPGRPDDSDAADDAYLDPTMPGFGPMGTTGKHAFWPESPWYKAIARLAALRRELPALGHGEITVLDRGRIGTGRFGVLLPDDVVAWQRTTATSTAVVVVNIAPAAAAGPPVALELALLPATAPTRLTRHTRIVGATIENRRRASRVELRSQTGVPALLLGPLEPGEVRVYEGSR